MSARSRSSPIATVDELAGLGISVVGGFDGLCPVDIDTDNQEIMVAVAKVLSLPTSGQAWLQRHDCVLSVGRNQGLQGA